MARARSVVVLLRDLSSGIEFFGPNGIGLPILQSSDTLVEIGTGGTPLLLKAAPSEAFCSTGYSPMLTFDVPDLDAAVLKALAQGAHLDGPIQFPAYGKVASLRSPLGFMVGLLEPAVESNENAGIGSH